MSTTINILDLIVIGFTLIFLITAFFRGFIKEIFSLINWLLAFFISYVVSPVVTKLFIGYYSGNEIIFAAVVRIIIFLLVFVAAILSTSGLCKTLKEKISTPIDRSLGVGYGLIKSMLVFGFLYATTVNLYGVLLGKKFHNRQEVEESLPKFFQESKSHNIIRFAGNAIDYPVKKFLEVFMGNMGKQLNDLQKLEEEKDAEENKNHDDLDDRLKDSGYSGYNKKDLEKMNRLIEIIDK